MENDKTNILDVIFFFGCTLLFGGLALAAWAGGETVVAIITSLLALLVLFVLVSGLKQGVRAPTRYEWFRTWMTLRPIVVVIGGLGLMGLGALVMVPLIKDWPQPVKVAIVLLPVLIWAGAVFYTIWRAPQRYESDEAWRKRVRYKAKDNSST